MLKLDQGNIKEVIEVNEVVMKRANGMGSVYRLQGNRRKPWVACVTMAIHNQGSAYSQKRKIIGYFESQEKAKFSLWNYNRNPILLDEIYRSGSLTFQYIYEGWSKAKYRNLSISAVNGYRAAYQRCERLKSLKIDELRTLHFQDIMDESSLSIASDLKLKSLMVSVCEYAMQNDIIQKNYAKYVIINKKEAQEKIHKPFHEEEIEKLFKNDHIPYVDTILIMIYTGFRVGELLQIKVSDIDIKNMTIRAGIKTEAGRNRMVPIHPKIQGYILRLMVENEHYLIMDQQTHHHMTYHTYRFTYFDDIMKCLHMNHLPHDCRHTFATRLSNEGANETSIRKLIGHTSYLTTEKIYTHKDIRQLRLAINSLK